MTRREFQFRDNSAEAYRLKAALHRPDGWPTPPPGFRERCLAAVQGAMAIAPLRPKVRFSRPMKIAASITAMAAFSALAAWVAVERIFSSVEPAREVRLEQTVAVDQETETITKESGVKMIARKAAGIVGAALTTLSVGATELTSEPTFVFLRPETSSFWHTATNNTMTVPIDFPAGATSARLYVSGVKYNCVYDEISASEFTFELPPAESPETENVYDLRLEFNDASGTFRTAKLGLIQGLSPDAEGVTRCIAPASGRLWAKAKGRAVLPIPYGTTSFTVNGTETATGLDGAQGWYALPITADQDTSLTLIANAVQYSASIHGQGGVIIIFR